MAQASHVPSCHQSINIENPPFHRNVSRQRNTTTSSTTTVAVTPDNFSAPETVSLAKTVRIRQHDPLCRAETKYKRCHRNCRDKEKNNSKQTWRLSEQYLYPIVLAPTATRFASKMTRSVEKVRKNKGLPKVWGGRGRRTCPHTR